MAPSKSRVRLTTAVLSILLLAGIGIALRLVRHHEVQVYGDATAALTNCPQTETINCEVVNTSPWSEFLGIPIAAFAVPTYLLVMGLVLLGLRHQALHAYAFCIGLLTALYSAFLFWVSSTQVGYLCLWCMSLYAVNLSIPVLVGLAAGGSPLRHVRRTLGDLLSWPGSLRGTAAVFVLLLAGTLATAHVYRREVRAQAAAERARIEEQGGPLLPAVPPSDGSSDNATPASSPPNRSSRSGSPAGVWSLQVASALPLPLGLVAAESAPAPAAKPPAGQAAAAPGKPAAGATSAVPYKLAGPVRRISGTKQKLLSDPFDLQGRLGHGKPVALIFWAPGFPDSERALVRMAAFLTHATPQFEVYAVAGRREDQQDEEIWERYAMFDLPPSLPFLLDDAFAVSQALTTTDVPDLAVFDGKGALVVAKIKDLSQKLVSATGNVPAETVLRQVANGMTVAQIQNMYPFYPSAELVGRCAPAFTARKFDTNDSYTFTGRSPSGKPTLLMFWSSTCKHCQQEIPQMVAWYAKHPGVVDVVSVTHIKSVDGSDAQHRKFTENYIRTQHIPWIVLEDPDNAIAELYRSDSTPTTYIMSPSSDIAEIWYYAHAEGDYGRAVDAALAKTRVAATCEAAPPAAAARLDFAMLAQDGKRVPLASLLDRPSLVHFWATWCAPCVAELPSLLRLRDKLEKSGAARVVLVSVEGEDAAARIAEFGKKQGLDLRSFHAPTGGLAEKVDLGHRVPRTYLVAPGGDVLALKQGSQEWDNPDFAARMRSRLDVLGKAGSSPPKKPSGAPTGGR